MRINPYNMYQQVQKSGQTGRKNQSLENTPYTETKQDKVSISKEAKIFAETMQRIHETEDVRMDKVNRLQEKINNDKYSVSSREVADTILTNLGIRKE